MPPGRPHRIELAGSYQHRLLRKIKHLADAPEFLFVWRDIENERLITESE
jgi:hypothetical protein